MRAAAAVVLAAAAVAASGALAPTPAAAQQAAPETPPVAGKPSAEDSAAVLESLARQADAIARESAKWAVTVVARAPAGPQRHSPMPGVVVVPPAGAAQVEAAGFLVETGIVATTFEVATTGASYEVRFADGRPRTAALLGADDIFRVAFLRVDSPADAAPVSETSPGPAAGRHEIAWLAAPGPSGRTWPQIAAVRGATCNESSYDRFLCASLCLQPGAAGSALVAGDGRLLGLAVGSVLPQTGTGEATAKHCRSTLFVRADDVVTAAREIASTGRMKHVRLGVMLDSDSNLVDQIVPGGPAERAGLREGDALRSVAGSPVANATDISRVLLRRRAGETVAVEYLRGDELARTDVRIDDVAMPAAPSEPPIDGVVLEWSWTVATADAPAAQRIDATQVRAGSRADAAGLRDGDRILEVDGTDVFRFVTRHRVRPAPRQPREIVVRRGDADLRLTLDR